MPGSRPVRHWKIVIAVSLLAFASGIVVGVAGTLHYVSNNLSRFIAGPDKMPERIVAQLRHELSLTDDQAKQVLAVFERSHGQLRAIRREAEPRIETIVQETYTQVAGTLKPEQREAWHVWFETMKLKFHLSDGEGPPQEKPAR